MTKKATQEIKIHYIGTGPAIDRLRESSISERNKADILTFKDWCLRNDYGAHRILKYLQTLPKVAHILNKDFRDAEQEDYERVVDWIVQSKFKDWTKQTYYAVLKKFVWWVENQKIHEENLKLREYNTKHPKDKNPELDEYQAGEYPKKIKWLKTSFAKNKGYHGTELPKELMDEEDALNLIKSSLNPRDKAVIAILFETGVRAGELLGLRIRDVEIGNTPGHSSHIIVAGKTGERRALIYWSAPYLRQWLNEHPDKDNPMSPLWTGLSTDKKYNERWSLSYPYLNKLLKEVEKRAKTGKPVNPHMFRHSSATRNARIMSQAQLNDYYGWSMNSSMASVYLHRAGLNTDSALLRAHGVIEDEEEFAKSELKPKKCVNCGDENDCEAKYCNKCGTPLTVAQALDRDDKVKLAGELFYKLTAQSGNPDEIRRALEGVFEKTPKSTKSLL